MRRHTAQMAGILVVVIAGLLTTAAPASAVTLDDVPPAMRKLSRGVANAATGFLEIGPAVQEVKQEKGLLAAVTLGAMLGFQRAVERTAAGVLEVVTFPFPLPRVGYRPLLTPEFLLEPD